MTKLGIVIGTILSMFTLDWFLRKYGEEPVIETFKRLLNKALKLVRRVMEKSWMFSKLAILWIEHIALILGGVVVGWWISRRAKRKDIVPERTMTPAQVRAIVTESITPAVEKQAVKEEVKEEVKAVSECPGWGKEFVAAIGQVWLEKNFGNPNYSGKKA